MKSYKRGSQLILTDLNVNEIAQILKIQIPLQFVFVKEKQIFKKIDIGERVNHGNKQKVMIDNTPTNYDVLFEDIGETLAFPGVVLSIILKLNDFRVQEVLFNIVGKIRPEIYENCVFYEYNIFNDTVKILYKTLPNGDSDKIYFFNKNATILAFDSNGPEIFTESIKINNITDFMCK